MLIFILCCPTIQVYTFRVSDASAERKTADKLLPQVISVLQALRSEWKMVIIGVCTDASGETRKMRRLLGEDPEWSHLMLPDCYAHQV